MKAAREAWFDGQLDLDPDALVFLDETAANTSMVRPYGRAPRGERCRVAAPFGHWKTTTVTAALRTSGLIATALLEPLPITLDTVHDRVTAGGALWWTEGFSTKRILPCPTVLAPP